MSVRKVALGLYYKYMNYTSLASPFLKRYKTTINSNRTKDTVVPRRPTWVASDTNSSLPTQISNELLQYLERTSLVEFSDEDSRRQLKEAIIFASQIMDVDTTGVTPLHSLNEKEAAFLREDEITEGNCREELLNLAVKSVEDLYYVAPPGNIPLGQVKKTNAKD